MRKGLNMVQDIRARAFDFAVRVVKLCQDLEKRGMAGKLIGRQLLRSGTSVGANLEESKGSQSPADYAAKVHISLKEARETAYWLKLLVASDILASRLIEPLQSEADQIISILVTILKKAKSP